MKSIVAFFQFCWNLLNFIRNLVMNMIFLVFVLLVIFMIGISRESGDKRNAENMQGALLLNLDGYLADNRDDSLGWRKALQELDGQRVPSKISVFDLVYAIRHAAEDERISGLALDLNNFEGAGLPALEYVGDAIQHFKQSKKTVIAFADNYTQSQYLLASYADEIYLNPIGAVEIQGLAVNNLFFKSMLDKLEVNPHIFRVGTYKSAVEPFLRDDMSAEAKQNLQRWLDQMWSNYQSAVAENRHIDKKDVLPPLQTYLNELKTLKGDEARYAQQRKLISTLATRLELEQKLVELFGKDNEGMPNMLEFEGYLKLLPDRMAVDSGAENKIAVINVEGAITDGESDEENVGGDTIAGLLREAYEDQRVKAVILRVNSPGGSAFASEIIRQETENLQKAGKPVVVSMGEMAASGGYWISSTADYIVADKNTLTGSIGIFAMFPTFEKTLKKAGISSDGAVTSPLSGATPFSRLSPELSDIYQLQIERGYDKFLDIVSRGRELSKGQVDKVAQGQVWLGQEALKLKLVDELGNFDVAVERAGELVNRNLQGGEMIENFAVEWFNEREIGTFTALLRDLKRDISLSVREAWGQSLGLSPLLKQLGKQSEGFNGFNDPKGQYLYCLNCFRVN
ncbi:protease-4 [Mesocricetibacter intestinalis]|uniref:Protease-4 n=1 Tax=Mesocricetibacter intestinalis TaxID=1521930 RepID=A0A4R6VEG9_9PAST|nr:signal peptide peptidase SppA [Mesocricetibacter intestinalis]TDQ59001.1 protease-4 [Mesocricetibacter intestinalis]